MRFNSFKSMYRNIYRGFCSHNFDVTDGYFFELQVYTDRITFNLLICAEFGAGLSLRQSLWIGPGTGEKLDNDLFID